jgi:hypothetical protein
MGSREEARQQVEEQVRKKKEAKARRPVRHEVEERGVRARMEDELRAIKEQAQSEAETEGPATHKSTGPPPCMFACDGYSEPVSKRVLGVGRFPARTGVGIRKSRPHAHTALPPLCFL